MTCSPRRTPAPARTPRRSPGSKRRRPTTRGCYRRSATSTSASGAGRMRRTRTQRALQRAPRNVELKVALRPALLNAGGRDERRQGARRAARGGGVAPDRAPTQRALYLLSQAERRVGDLDGGRSDGAPADRAEQQEPVGLLRARRGARGAAAVPGRRRRARAGGRGVPRSRPATRRSTVGMLLPHLGFAYQELGAVRQGDRGLRGGAQARAGRSGRSPAI